MATLREKRNGSIACSSTVLLVYATLCLEQAYSFNMELAMLLLSSSAFAGWRIARKLGSPNDTVIYHLRRRGRVVYVGVAYERRVGLRIHEHKQSGKRFDQVDIGRPRPRAEALKLEARRIRRMQPKYNIAGKPT